MSQVRTLETGLSHACLAVMLSTCVPRWSGKPWLLYDSWKHIDLLGGGGDRREAIHLDKLTIH